MITECHCVTFPVQLSCFLVQADENADIGGTLEDEDDSSDDPNLQVIKRFLYLFSCVLERKSFVFNY